MSFIIVHYEARHNKVWKVKGVPDTRTNDDFKINRMYFSLYCNIKLTDK